jgi:hypothetical protein
MMTICLNVLVRLKTKILVIILELNLVVVTKLRLKRRPLQVVTSAIVSSQSEDNNESWN